MNRLIQLCLFASILCFAWQTQTVSGQTFPCYTQFNNTLYNLTSLMGTQMSGLNPGGDYTFYLQMCGVAPMCIRDGAMACQISNYDSNTQYDTAFPNDDIYPHYWTILQGGLQGLGGIQLSAYGSGLYCTAEGNERKTVIQVFCNPNVTAIPTNFTSAVAEGPICTYTMQFYHASGCPIALPPATIPPVTTIAPCGSSTDDSKVTGAGFGVGIAVGSVVTACLGVAFVFVNRRKGSKWNKMDEDRNMNTLPDSTHGAETTMNN